MDAAYTQARRRATPRHAVRIIKRNYCRAVVNNAMLLKRVGAYGYARVEKSPRSGRVPRGDLGLTLRSAGGPVARESAGRLATSPAGSRDLASEGREKLCFGDVHANVCACVRACGCGHPRSGSRLWDQRSCRRAARCGKAIFAPTSTD